MKPFSSKIVHQKIPDARKPVRHEHSDHNNPGVSPQCHLRQKRKWIIFHLFQGRTGRTVSFRGKVTSRKKNTWKVWNQASETSNFLFLSSKKWKEEKNSVYVPWENHTLRENHRRTWQNLESSREKCPFGTVLHVEIMVIESAWQWHFQWIPKNDKDFSRWIMTCHDISTNVTHKIGRCFRYPKIPVEIYVASCCDEIHLHLLPRCWGTKPRGELVLLTFCETTLFLDTSSFFVQISQRCSKWFLNKRKFY